MMNPKPAYQPPRPLLDEAKQELAAVDQAKLFNNSKYEKSREKWCAGMLGLGYEKHVAACRVAVNDSRERVDADIWLKTAGRQFAFQVVEVMEPERRRGAEYKALAGGLARGFGYDTERGRIDGPQWIANAVAQKVAKKYADAEQLNLLVYANFSAHQLQHVDVVNTARTYFPAFASIWVVTNLWLGSLNVSNQLGRIDGWGIIFTPEQYLRDQAG